MFKFLKDKVKSVISSISKKIEESPQELEEPKKQSKILEEIKQEIRPEEVPEPHEEFKEKKVEESKKPHKEEVVEPIKEKVREGDVSIEKSLIERLTKRIQKLSEGQIDILFERIGWIDADKGENKALPYSRLKEIRANYKKAYNFLETVLQKSDLAEVQSVLESLEKAGQEKPSEIQSKEKIIEGKLDEQVPVEAQKKGFFSKIKEKIAKKEEPLEIKAVPKEEKGFLGKITEKITTKKISQSEFEELFWDLELALLESNVALEVVEKIKLDLKEKLVDQPLKRSLVSESIESALKESIRSLFEVKPFDLKEKIKTKKPFVICLVGINGSGKTTTTAKLAYYLKKNKFSCVLAAADTFRAAAISQLKEWGNELNVKVIAHEYGSDPAAVAFDGIKHAEAHNVDVVLIDTAGRLHSNKDLVREMEKIVRIAKPDLKIFIGESITGNDCVTQAKEFNDSIGIDGIILAKADVDEKGGAAISVSYVTKKPILYLGVGQKASDLEEFNVDQLMEKLGL